MVIGIAKVAVIEEPDVADVEDFVIGASEELCEILTGLEEIRQPDHGWQIALSSL